jgi:hypothetical protein
MKRVQCSDYSIYRSSVMLIFTAIQVSHRPCAVDNKSRRVGDIQRIHSQAVIQAVSLGGRPIFVE